ncbi:MAG: histidine phosphatase family protein [Opitutales bacterium]|nr:histidine phosphatase family protein [Opitutales bacterium]
MKLTLLRHAESVGNATGEYSLLQSDSLSEKGWEQAGHAAAALQNGDFEKVIVSPLRRALETLVPYLEKSGRVAEIWPEIAETPPRRDCGEPAAEAWPTEKRTLPEGLKHRFVFRDSRGIKPAPGESVGQGLRRILDAEACLQALAAEGCRSVLMVTHGHFMGELINRLLNIHEFIYFYHQNCSMTQLLLRSPVRFQFGNLPIGIPKDRREAEFIDLALGSA